jgi:hypothetical protein
MTEEQGTGAGQLPPYVIENARSGRARCKTCRRVIPKDQIRIGILIEGPYGPGYLWHHLKCAARRQFDRVEEAYRLEAWNEAKDPPGKVPPLDELRRHAEKAEERRQTRKDPPYAEVDPSGRARCKHCGEPIAKDSVRVVLGRRVQFGNQVRTSSIHVHPGCVAAALDSEDNATEPAGLVTALRENSEGLSSERLETLLGEIGPIPGA